MKIVHFGKFYPPEYGGIESVTEALAEDHADAGHQVDVICFTNGAAQVLSKGTLTVRRLACLGKLSSQPLSLRYLFAAIASSRGADIVHVHTPNLLASLAALFSSRTAKVVVHWHADIAGKGVLRRLTQPLEFLMLLRCDAVVCTSAAYLETSPALRGFRFKCKVIPLGISEPSPACVASRSDFVEEISKPYILFIGRLVPYKGLDDLLRVVALLTSGIRCVIVGVGPEGTRLRELAEKLGIADRIDFLGRAEHAHLDELLSGAAVFCLTSNSRLEAFGVVLLEAMRAGCPVVSMDIPGSGVSWVNQAGIVVPKGDVRAFAQAVNHLIENEDARALLGAEGRKRFMTNFLRSNMSDRFIVFYENLVKEAYVTRR